MNITQQTKQLLRITIDCKQRGATYFEYVHACEMSGVSPMPSVVYKEEQIILMQIALSSYELMYATILKAQRSSRSCN